MLRDRFWDYICRAGILVVHVMESFTVEHQAPPPLFPSGSSDSASSRQSVGEVCLSPQLCLRHKYEQTLPRRTLVTVTSQGTVETDGVAGRRDGSPDRINNHSRSSQLCGSLKGEVQQDGASTSQAGEPAEASTDASGVFSSRARNRAEEHSHYLVEQRRAIQRQRSEESFVHEQDHDPCPFTAVRRSELALRIFNAVHRTSPLSFRNILSSFSVKNDFMFYPPPSTYWFTVSDQGVVDVCSSGRDCEPMEQARPHRNFFGKTSHRNAKRAIHGVAWPAASSDETCPSFEMFFIPWRNELQSYCILDNTVVFGKKIKIGGPLFLGSLRCPIPCSVIRPRRRMSSHVAIFFHCNGEDIGRTSCERLMIMANALHMTILVPEYPGYGLFNGRPSEASIKGSMERVVQYLFAADATLTPSRLLLIGHSIGTGVAMHVAQFIGDLFQRLKGSKDLQARLPYACPTTCSYNWANGTETSSPVGIASTNGLEQRQSSFVHGEGQRYNSTPTSFAPQRAPYGNRSGWRGTVMPCQHYALGGIILLSPFASIRCLEMWSTCKKLYKLSNGELVRRRCEVPMDLLTFAPVSWCDDASTSSPIWEEKAATEQPAEPLLFRISRYISFNRFPTVDVACMMQERDDYFCKTPLLLLHGSNDNLVPPIHSVAIASKLRQCHRGDMAKIYLAFLSECGHNNMNCASLIRRFYKDVILVPHLERQRLMQRELEETLRWQPGKSPKPHHHSVGCSEATGGSVRTAEVTVASPSLRVPSELEPALATSLLSLTHQHSAGEGGDAADQATKVPQLYFIEPCDKGECKDLLTRHATSNGAAAPVRIRFIEFPWQSPHPPPEGPHMSSSVPAKAATATLARERGAAQNARTFMEPLSASNASADDLRIEVGSSTDRRTPYERLSSSLHHTLRRTQRPNSTMAPAATMLHIAMLPRLDHYDVGSVAVAAVTRHAIDVAEARQLRMRHKHLEVLFRCILTLASFAASLYFLAIAICHVVLTKPRNLKAFLPEGTSAAEFAPDARVVVWGVLQCLAFVFLSLERFFRNQYDFGKRSKLPPGNGAGVMAYHSFYFISFILCIGIGILMGMIVALTPYGRGGVNWAKWAPLPYSQRVWISYIPRWSMVAAASLHLSILVFIIVRNH